MKTFDDLELEAYIRGDIVTAKIYGLLIENEDARGELADTYDRVHDLEWDIDYLKEVNRELEDDIEYWRKRAIEAEGKLEETKFILESLSK